MMLEKNVCGKNSSSSEKKAWKKIQACTGFESMTSAIPVQFSTNWANKPAGSWSLCWFIISSVHIYDFHINTVIDSSLHGFIKNRLI